MKMLASEVKGDEMMIFPLEYVEFVAQPRAVGADSQPSTSAGWRMIAVTGLVAALAFIGWVIAGGPASAQTGEAAPTVVATVSLDGNVGAPKRTDLVESTDRRI